MNLDIPADFSETVERYVDELRWLESNIAPDVAPDFDAFYDRLCDANSASLDSCRQVEEEIGEDARRLAETQQRFRESIDPWFAQSWFMQRAATKPRGYPGDHAILRGIYDNAPKEHGLGGYLDLYFLNTPLAMAVRDRLRAARAFLLGEVSRSQTPLRILNVACGPCRELTHGWHAAGRPVHVTLIDMDQEALSCAKQRLSEVSPDSLQTETATYNALRMSSAERNIEQFGRPDLIYSIGLCDYIPDNYLIRILRGWRETLAAEGTVYVSFKDCREYDKTGYAWHVDWHFIPRTEEHCRQLFAEAGYDMDGLELKRRESPVIMNFVCRSSEPAEFCVERDGVRVDKNLVVG